MDYKKIEKEIQSLYTKKYSEIYRASDIAEVEESFHEDITKRLRDITIGFPYPIDVLDVGCGTGRYFYAIKNAQTLTGIDVSAGMLSEAKNPIKKEEITASSIHLIPGDIFQHPFPDSSFDFIYSIGVLGEHSPFDVLVCQKIYKMLRSKGKALITIVDAQSMWKRRLAEVLYPVLPQSIKEKLHFRRKSFYMYQNQLESLLQQSDFENYDIIRTISKSSKWRGAHFECLLMKS